MKYKIIIITVLLISSIALLSMFNVQYPHTYKENVLYSQNDISGYNEKETE